MRIRHFLGVSVLSLLCLGQGAQAQSPAVRSRCPVDVADAIAPILTDAQWARSRWGLLIQSLNSGEDLYQHQSEAYFLVASNVKLLTTAAALHHWGPDWQIQTPITWSGVAPHLETLHLEGQGDPSLTTADLRQMAQTLAAQGVRSVQTLSVSARVFPQAWRQPTWELYDANFYYAAPVGGLILNENAFLLTLTPQTPGEPVRGETEDTIALRQWRLLNASLTTAPGSSNTLDLLGSVGDRALTVLGTLPADHNPERWWLAVRDPAQYLLATWRKELILAGITVKATQVRDRAPQPSTGQMTLTSDPLAELIRDTNQPSSNVYAEALWLHLAHSATLPDTAPLEHSLTQLGVDPATYKLADGSGLSRHNLVSPRAIAQTLHSIAHSPNAQVFQASLPVAGESGTLRRRFQETPLAGQVWAKTGTLTGVSALSGYLRQPGEEALIFSIVLNQATVSVHEQRQAIDAMVGAIATWQTCQSD